MIINRYLQSRVLGGSFAALLVLLSLGIFFLFVRELEHLGQGSYGLLQMVEYVALMLPGKVVEFTPLATLLGTILSLGALAGNSEIIAMQASGISMRRMLFAVMQAALIIALTSFVIADWVVPESETTARKNRSIAQQNTTAVNSREGLWIKDDFRILHIEELQSNGIAQNVEIFELDQNDGLARVIRAARAVPVGNEWRLLDVEVTIIGRNQVSSKQLPVLTYAGQISHQLLQVLLIEPRQMSTNDLFSYLNFLDENKLDSEVERLVLWKKLFSPLTIVIMCLLAFPFVLGAQRQANTGQRLLMGIILGLAFVVTDRLLTQLGVHLKVNTIFLALLPNLIFLALGLYLLLQKLSHKTALNRKPA